MDKVLRHWSKYAEQSGITPISFKAAQIVKLDDHAKS
jgi:hypothetical protein